MFGNEKKLENQKNATENSDGLAYNYETIGDLISKDTDADGILDWEENLWGTDPSKKETTPGISDKETVAKLKAEKEREEPSPSSTTPDAGNLNKTDQFSRELFSTVTALSQGGPVDPATLQELGASLAEKIRNTPAQKVFLVSDIKVVKNDTRQDIIKYDDTLNNIYKKHPLERSVSEVLQDFIIDEENVDTTALKNLDPINIQIKAAISDIVKMSVPQSLAELHLDFLNKLQMLSENIDNIKLYETDILLALSGISQYETNMDLLEAAAIKLGTVINQKLNS